MSDAHDAHPLACEGCFETFESTEARAEHERGCAAVRDLAIEAELARRWKGDDR